MRKNSWLMTQSQIPLALTAALGSFCLGVVLPIPQDLSFFGSEDHILPAVPPTVEIPTQHRFLAKAITDIKAETQRPVAIAIPQSFQGKTFAQVNINSKKVVALTFDDGPWPDSTLAILDTLKKQQVKATFFMVGKYLEQFPKIAQQVAAQGHHIENHSWTHTYRTLTPAQAAQEINRTSQLITKISGRKPVFFRPPGGFLKTGLVNYAQQKKYGIALWSADSRDYRAASTEILRKNVLSQVRPGGMILLHDGGGSRKMTIAALPLLIEELKKQGYQFVTVSELVTLADQEAKIATSARLSDRAKQKQAAKSPKKPLDKPAKGEGKP